MEGKDSISTIKQGHPEAKVTRKPGAPMDHPEVTLVTWKFP